MWAYRVEWVEYRGRYFDGAPIIRPMRYYARSWETARLRLEVVKGRVGASKIKGPSLALGRIIQAAALESWLRSWVHEVGG